MNSENFYFSNASKMDLGKKISRLYLIGNISEEEYTDKIRNIADKMKADDAYIGSVVAIGLAVIESGLLKFP